MEVELNKKYSCAGHTEVSVAPPSNRCETRDESSGTAKSIYQKKTLSDSPTAKAKCSMSLLFYTLSTFHMFCKSNSCPLEYCFLVQTMRDLIFLPLAYFAFVSVSSLPQVASSENHSPICRLLFWSSTATQASPSLAARFLGLTAR